MTIIEHKTHRKTMPKAKAFGLSLLIALLFVVLMQLHDGFVLYPSQRLLLNNLEREFSANGGVAKLDRVFPRGDWDTVCIIPAYSFSKSPKRIAEIRQYLGSHYEYDFFATPDPYAVAYGLGFAFIKNGDLEKFVRLPAGRQVHVPEHYLSGRRYEVIHLTDLNVRTQNPGQSCYPRDTAFLKFNSYQDISIGG